jgi:hypothetical protein
MQRPKMRLSLPALVGVLLALMVAGLVGPAPAHAQFPTPQVVAARKDPCPGASLCGDFTKGRFKSGGLIASQFQALPNLTVTRASFAYGENADGSLRGFQAGQARWTSKGLGVFEATTNLLVQSVDLTNGWTTSNAAVVATAAAVAPDPTSTAYKLTDSAANTFHGLYRTSAGAITAGATVTQTWYAKAGELRYGQFSVDGNDGNGAYANVDLQTCAVVQSALIGTGTLTSATAEPKANGWCRVVIVGKIAAAVTNLRGFAATANSATLGWATAYVGSGQGIYLWGPDARAGAYPVPYCPTTSSAATCAADLVKFAGVSATPLSAVVEVQSAFAPTGFSRLLQFDDGTTTNRITLYRTNSTGTVGLDSVVGTGSAVAGGTGTAVAGSVLRVSGRWQSGTNGLGLSVGGVASPAATAAAVPTTNTLRLGLNVDATTPTDALNGYIRAFAVYPNTLSDVQLAAYSTGSDLSSLSLNFASGLYKTTTPYVRTNLVPNGNGAGASGSTLPTGWALDQAYGGITPSAWTSTTNALGRPSAQFRINGTIAGTQRLLLAADTNSAGQRFAITAGTTFTVSYDVQLAAGSTTNALQLTPLYYDAGGVFLSSGAGQSATITSAGQRITDTFTAPANTATVHLRWDFTNQPAAGTAVDFTVNLGALQLETGRTTATSYIQTTTAAASVATTQSTNPADVGALSYTGPAGYATDCNGNLVSFAANNPRITCGGVLIEEATTNLETYSQDSSQWTPQSTSVSTGQAAPDGTSTAFMVTSTPNANSFISTPAITLANNTAYTESLYFKPVSGTGVIALEYSTGSSLVGATCNGLTGATTNGAIIAPLANGWWRCSVTMTTAATGTPGMRVVYVGAYGATATQTSVLLWQKDIVQKAFATSPIFTTSASVTRPADVMVYGLSLSPTALTLAGTGSSVSQPVVARLASLTDGVNNLDIDANGGTAGYVTGNTLTGGGASVGPTLTAGLPISVAASLSAGAVHGSGNGQAATTLGGTQTMGTITTLRVGDLYTGGRPLNGYERELHLYPYAANDNELPYRAAGNF